MGTRRLNCSCSLVSKDNPYKRTNKAILFNQSSPGLRSLRDQIHDHSPIGELAGIRGPKVSRPAVYLPAGLSAARNLSRLLPSIRYHNTRTFFGLATTSMSSSGVSVDQLPLIEKAAVRIQNK